MFIKKVRTPKKDSRSRKFKLIRRITRVRTKKAAA